jgi:hypothetical protein
MDDPKVKKIFFWIKIFKYPNSKSYHPKVKFQDLLPKCVLSFAKLSLEVEIIVGHLQVAVPQLQLRHIPILWSVGWSQKVRENGSNDFSDFLQALRYR